MSSPGNGAFNHRSVLKGTFYLMGGNVIGQIINLVGLLFLSRIYDPASVGLWAMFLGFGFMVQFLAGMHYDLAVVIVDDDEDAARLAVLGIGVSAMMAAIVTLLLQILFFFDFSWMTPGLKDISLGYAPYIFCYGIYNAATAWGIRKRKYPWLMVTRFCVPLFTLLLQYAFRNNHMIGNGLILGTLGSYTVIATWCTVFLYKPLTSALAGKLKTLAQDLKAIARRERGFPLYSIPRAVIVSFSNQVVVVLLGVFYSLSVVGAFNMAYRALYAPMVLIGSALAQAIMPSLSEVKGEIYKLERQLMTIIRMLGWIYLPMLTFIVMYGPQVFSFVFGAKWEDAGHYAGYLTMALFGAAMTMWLEKIFDILDRQRLHLVLGIVLNASCLLVYLLAHALTQNAEIMVVAWSASMLVYACVWLAVACKICGFSLLRLAGVGAELAVVAGGLLLMVPLCLQADHFFMRFAGLAAVFTVYGVSAYLALRKDVNSFINQSVPVR